VSFVLFKPPEIIKEYTPDDIEESLRFLDEILNGSIATNLKLMVSRDFASTIAYLFENLERSYEEAIENYERFGNILRTISQNEDLLDKMEHEHSPILESNFRFAIASLMSLLQSFYISIKSQPVPDAPPPKNFVEKIEKEFSRYSKISNSEMPDASSLFSPDDKFSGFMAMILLAYNFALFSVLVVVTAIIAAAELDLSNSQLEEVESLLRDWPQEFVAQIALIQRNTLLKPNPFGLSGIIPTEEENLME